MQHDGTPARMLDNAGQRRLAGDEGPELPDPTPVDGVSRDPLPPPATRRLRGPWPLRVYIIGLVVLVAVAAGATVFYQRSAAAADARQSAIADVQFASGLAARDIAVAMSTARTAVATTAAVPGMAKVFDNPSGCTLTFQGPGPFVAGHIDVVGADGAVACSSLAGSPTSGYRGAEWLTGALQRSGVVGPVLDARSSKQVILVSAPIAGKGTVAAFLDLEAFGQGLAANFGGPRHLEFVITTQDVGRVLARSIDSARWVGAPLAGTAFAGARGQLEHRDLGRVTRLYGQATVENLGWLVFAGADKSQALAAANRLSNRELAITLAGLAVFLVALWVIYRRVTRPIAKLSEGVRSATAHTTSGPIAVAGPAEVSTLVDDFNELLAASDRELEAASRLASIVESSADAIMGVNLAGNITSWNAGAERMYGYSADVDEMVGRSALTTLVPPDRAEEAASLLETVKRGERVEQLETQRLHKDGRLLEVSIAFSPIRDAAGTVTGASSVSRDMTERRRAEAERRELEEKLRRSERLEDQQRELRLVGDRERIGRDLHDSVIQRIFATGLAMQVASTLITDHNARQRVDAAIEELDGVIREIRTVIFDIEPNRARSVTDSVLDLTREATETLGFEPSVAFDGPVDALIPGHIADQLLATLRESLSNVARHAFANRVAVNVVVDHDITLVIADDGVGIDHGRTKDSGLGLANMNDRARQLGGQFIAERTNGGGTRLEWRVPVAGQSPT